MNRTLCLLAITISILAACAPAELTLTDGGPPPQQCPEGQLTCTGDPDQNTLVCSCTGVFQCPTPEKCVTPTPMPGGGNWVCTWQEFKYTCTSPDAKAPDGGSGWTCVTTEQGVSCSTTPAAPDGSGSWICTVIGSTLQCDKKVGGTGVWNCTPDKKVCTEGPDSLPGGGEWKCHQVLQAGVPTWVCVGSTPPPGGGDWVCVKLDEFNGYRCEKAVEPPPGGGNYQCTMGTELGGTKCELVPPPIDANACQIGELRWCDGQTYCGWGQVACDPATGKWKTKKRPDGTVVEDCNELANAARPNTVCACYYFFFNPECCERPDCVVPSGTKPQICPASAGGLCDYCNPYSPECTGTGAKCIVSNQHETFCGELCSAQKPCPAGYQCMLINLSGGQTTNQCVPADLSCYR